MSLVIRVQLLAPHAFVSGTMLRVTEGFQSTSSYVSIQTNKDKVLRHFDVHGSVHHSIIHK